MLIWGLFVKDTTLTWSLKLNINLKRKIQCRPEVLLVSKTMTSCTAICALTPPVWPKMQPKIIIRAQFQLIVVSKKFTWDHRTKIRTKHKPNDKYRNPVWSSPGIIGWKSGPWLLLDLRPAQRGPMMAMLTWVLACNSSPNGFYLFHIWLLHNYTILLTKMASLVGI